MLKRWTFFLMDQCNTISIVASKITKNFKIGNDHKHEHNNFRFRLGHTQSKLLNGIHEISKGNDNTKRQHFTESVIEMWCKGNEEVYLHSTITKHIFGVRKREKKDSQVIISNWMQHPTILYSKTFQHLIHTLWLNSKCKA